MTKTAIYILFILFIISILFISGCSLKQQHPQKDWERFNRTGELNRTGNFNRTMPSDDGNRQEGFAEMQENMKNACENQTEGSSCIIETPMGQMDGTCTLQNEILFCINQDRQIRRPE